MYFCFINIFGAQSNVVVIFFFFLNRVLKHLDLKKFTRFSVQTSCHVYTIVQQYKFIVVIELFQNVLSFVIL